MMNWIGWTAGLLATAGAVAAMEPSKKNVAYSEDFDRSKMDLWLPEGEGAKPVVVFFHGGGFRKGSKDGIPFRREMLGLVQQNTAVVSVGYPFLGDQGKVEAIGPRDYAKIIQHTEKAVEFLKENAGQYRLDPERMVVVGVSAGALISQHLTYEADLGISLCIAIEQPYEVKSVMEAISGGEPPMILFTRAGPDDMIHHPRYARQLKDHCDKVGVPCHLYGSEKSGLPTLPDGRSFLSRASEIVQAHWKDES